MDRSSNLGVSDRPRQSLSRRTFVGAAVAGSVLGGLTCHASPAPKAVGPDSWPQWRGPLRDGRLEQSWPNSLDEGHLSLVWQQDLAESYSGPIVDATRVYTTETRNQSTEHAFAFDRLSGEKIWEISWKGALSVPFYAKRNGDWIRATPALADNKLLVAGIRDHLVCLQADSGERLWEIDCPAEFETPVPSFGCVCSPLIDDGYAYMQAASGLVKIDMQTGQTQWHVLAGSDSDSAFSSPIIAELCGIRQLIVQTRQRLVGVDLQTGKLLWEQQIPAFRGMNILTPTIIGNRIFTSSYGGKAWMYEVALDADSQWSVSQVWENKLQAYMSTPVVLDGHIYLHLKNQRCCCIHADSGEITWTTQPFGQYWSIVCNEDRLLALDQTGMLRLIAADPTGFQLISERQVSTDETWAHVAICGEHLVVRALHGLSLYRWS